jgi:NADPH-dependent F420 reductase
MRIAVVGAGAMGVALARGWAAAGHAVAIGSRNVERARSIADRVGTASGADYAGATAAADVVLLTVPWQAVRGIVPDLDLAGKVLIDATNPYLDDTFDGGEGTWSLREAFPPGESGASVIQALVPRARVVKAFNHIWARAAEHGFAETRPAVFVCGADPEARSVVAGLAAEIGYDPHDVGGLEHACWLEALTPLVVALGDPALALTMTRSDG